MALAKAKAVKQAAAPARRKPALEVVDDDEDDGAKVRLVCSRAGSETCVLGPFRQAARPGCGAGEARARQEEGGRRGG